MLTEFWKSVGGKLADRWITVSIPALVFWLGGIAAWTYHRGGLHTLTSQTSWLGHQIAAVQAIVIVTALLAVAASAVLVNWAATPLLRLLEGYWPRWAKRLRDGLAGWLAKRAATEQAAWQRAQADIQPPAIATAEQLATYARLESRRRRRPSHAGYFLPTPIGNILRAAERRPFDKYGLDTVFLWSRLWPALPDTLRSDLLSAHAALVGAVTTATWGVMFCVFASFTLLAIPIGLAIALVSVIVIIPNRAQSFGDLLEAAFDQHRAILYLQTRWPLPNNPNEEHACGQQLTSYLLRGSNEPSPTFSPPGFSYQLVSDRPVSQIMVDGRARGRSLPRRST